LGLVGDVQIPVRAVVGKAKGNISGENQLNPFSVLMGFVEDRHQTTAYIYPAMHECQHCAVKINKLRAAGCSTCPSEINPNKIADNFTTATA